MHLYRASSLVVLSAFSGILVTFGIIQPVQAQRTQRTVESVAVVGNRRLRQDDILYWVQTRPGDPYNVEQIERDYQAILALGFFDKTATRVQTETGSRGGVNIIFEVRELPIIQRRDL